MSPNYPIDADIFVVEGWLPDQSMEIIAEKYVKNKNNKVIVTGGPIDHGFYLHGVKTYAEMGCKTLTYLSGREDIIAVPSLSTKKNKTFASALTLKNFLNENNMLSEKINLVTLDSHGRRSWYLFKKALGDKYSVGIITIYPKSYQEEKWWSNSHRFKKVINESIAYIYTILIFPGLSDNMDELNNVSSK